MFISKSLLAQTRLEVYKNALDNFEIPQDSSVSHRKLSSGARRGYREWVGWSRHDRSATREVSITAKYDQAAR